MVPMKLLQKSAQHIAPDTARLINNLVTESIFPGDLKFAEVSPLFKKKDNFIKLIVDPGVFSSLYLKYMKKPWVNK